MSFVEIENLTKHYIDHKGEDQLIFSRLFFSASSEKLTIITGPSGSGKTTLLKIISSIDDEYEGSVKINSEMIKGLSEKKRAKFRRESIGFIFQNHELIPQFNVIQNVALPLRMNGLGKKKAEIEAEKAIEVFCPKGDISNLNKYPRELSGGQQQRICIARAIIHNPGLILADEPTGNLDHKNAKFVINALKHLSSVEKKCVIIVTHHHLFSDFNDIEKSFYSFAFSSETEDLEGKPLSFLTRS